MLALPPVKEACPHGLAPTTSALIQLALGDCLAIALLEGRGFTALDYKVFHPGGQLGAKLKHVGDIMHTGEQAAGGARGRADEQRARGDDGEELRLPWHRRR